MHASFRCAQNSVFDMLGKRAQASQRTLCYAPEGLHRDQLRPVVRNCVQMTAKLNALVFALLCSCSETRQLDLFERVTEIRIRC